MPLRAGGVQSDWLFSQRFIDTEQDRPRWRTTLDYRISPTLQLGVEYNPAVGELGVRGNWFIQTETDSRPGLIAGTSSDRIGTPHGQAYFLTAAKRLGDSPVAPYVSILYSEHDRGINFPFGAAVSLAPGWTLLPLYDGRHGHTTLTWDNGRESVTMIWAFHRRLGLSIGRAF